MKNIKLILFITIIVTLFFASIWLPLGSIIQNFVSWVKELGPLGMGVFALAYVFTTILMLPGLIFTLSAGFLYGPLYGFLIVSPASVVGATCAFLLGRYAFGDWVNAKIAKNQKFTNISEAVAREGFKIVFLLRLSPLFPFNLLNYGLGLTKVSTTRYILASFLGMIPGTFMYVYIGSIATHIEDIIRGNTNQTGGQTILYWIGLLATLIVTIVITKIAKKALSKQFSNKENNDDQASR